MKIFTSKKTMVAVLLFCLCNTVYSQTKDVTTEAGKLSEHISADEQKSITTLKVSGTINGSDILLLRKMAGKGVDDNATFEGKLSSLDLSEAQIVKGGANYYSTKVGSSTKYFQPKEDNVIAPYMFRGLTNLTTLKLPTNITKIERHAFSGCSGLTECTIPNDVTSIGANAFAQCSKLSSVTLSSSLEEIGTSAFENCTSLATISEFPESLSTIDEKAFLNTVITAFNVSSANNDFSVEDGVLYDKEKTTLQLYPCGRTEGVFTIPQGVSGIDNYAFAYAKNLKSIELSENLTTINESAFIYSGLETLTTNASGLSIGKFAFGYCTGLKTVSFKGAVSGIEVNAFQYANNLLTVSFAGAAVPELKSTIFTPKPRGEKLKIYVPKESIEMYKNAFTKKKAVLGTNYDVLDITTLGVLNPSFDGNVFETARYNVDGTKATTRTKGINIVKLSNGKVIKTIEK